MRTLGIIGGIAPESTVDYYRFFIRLYRERRPDGSYPPILINSIDLTRLLGFVNAQDLKGTAQYLLAEVTKLARGGADVGLFASNTPHIVFDEVARQSPIPLLSIVEATCTAVRELGLTRVGLLGTRSTMQGRFYPEMFARHGIDLCTPDPTDQAYVHDKYMTELVMGVFRHETRDGISTIVNRLVERDNIQAVILGGTELPLLLRDISDAPVPFLDTARIHVTCAIEHVLSQHEAHENR